MALIQHWKLDDNAATTNVVATVGTDGTLLGGDNTDTLHSATGPGTAITSSLDFNGSDDAVDISGSGISFASGSAFSVSAFVNPDFFGRAFIGLPTGAFQHYIRPVSTTSVGVRINNTTLTFTVGTMTAGTWIHVLVTRDTSNNVRVFVDGTESSTGSQAGAATFAPTRIGVGNNAHFDGRVAWLKIFNSDESANVAALRAEKDSAGGSIVPMVMHLMRQRRGG